MRGGKTPSRAVPATLPGLASASSASAPPRHLPPEAHLPQLQQALLAWFAAHQRPLPWRVNYTPYEVWISEVMLQQTQMERGVSYFTRWMARFPDVAALAAASEEEVLRLWEGLGYYSRARHVLAAARRIMDRHGGVFPAALEDIRALPGVGPYTAGAIASIAFGEKLPCVDANVERVVARVFDLDTPVKQEPAASAVRAVRLDPAKNPDANAAALRAQAMKSGDTIFAVREAEVRGAEWFVPASLAAELRREALAALAGARRERRPEHRILPENPAAKYPSERLAAEENVTNRLAEAFYRDHGVRQIERGLDLASTTAGHVVLRSAYCIRREIGECLREHPRLRGDLFLEHGAYRYRLAFDCEACEMSLVDPLEKREPEGV